jgi:hypothetical protein
MAFDMFGVVKFKKPVPEVFWVGFADSKMMPKTNPCVQFSGDLDEAGVRAFLTAHNVSATDISELIAAARANPK